MKIIEYNEHYCEEAKSLFLELQEYIVALDKYHLNKVSDDFSQKYLDKTLVDLSSNNGKMFLAILDDIVIGLVCGKIESSIPEEQFFYSSKGKGVVTELIVSKLKRNIGVGEKLLACIEGYFIEKECIFSQLDVFAYNQNAINFYKKHNYEERVMTLFKKL